MNRTAHRLAFCMLLALLVSAAYAVNYMYLSDNEQTNFGDVIRFWHEDTLGGPVHSNSAIGIMEDPVFYDVVSTTAPDFWQGEWSNPIFLGPPPFFNAPGVEIPDTLYFYRENANRFYAPDASQQMRCVLSDGQATIYRWDLGSAFDSTTAILEEIVPLGSGTILFFECQLELLGRGVTGDVTVASSSRIRIMDDVRVEGIDEGYQVPEDNPNFITIATEGEIKIADTWANGHMNSSGEGQGQTDPELTDVVITANLYALGEMFTFEHQNDPDSGYVCECAPDERGTAYLFGGLTQQRRGYVHRVTRGGTGYRRHYRWDERLRSRPNVVIHDPFEEQTTDSLLFGDVPLGQTVTDTAEIFVRGYNALGAVMASQPYEADWIEPYFGSHFFVPVHFSPPQTGSFNGVLQVITSTRSVQIPLRGRGVLPNAADSTFIVPRSSFIVSAYPNPFNTATTFTFNLPTSGHVALELYDIQGRRAATLLDQITVAGEQHVAFDAQSLPSGIYIARLRTPAEVRYLKVMLVK